MEYGIGLTVVTMASGGLGALAPEDRVRAVARRIAREAPTLGDLDAEALEKLARAVVVESLKDTLKEKANLAKIDYPEERRTFEVRSSRTGSKATRRTYSAAIDRLETWCARRGTSVLELTPAAADDWVEAMKAEGASSATVRVRAAAVSSFFTWLERRHEQVANPLRGSKARPKVKARRTLAIPTAEEVTAIEEAADPMLRAAVSVMSTLGLRVGALPGLSVNGTRYTSTSKGREISGTVTPEIRKAIEHAGLSLRAPFETLAAGSIAERFRRVVGKVHADGKVRAKYSVHDLRHAVAVRLYTQSRDIYAVKQALGHASVTVTETYLRSIGVEGLAR